jgi:hypothetical protein
VLQGVLEASKLPKLGINSLCLFVKPAKTTSQLGQRCPKSDWKTLQKVLVHVYKNIEKWLSETRLKKLIKAKLNKQEKAPFFLILLVVPKQKVISQICFDITLKLFTN